MFQYKRISKSDGTTVMEPVNPPPITCLDLKFEEIQELAQILFLRYLKETKRGEEEFSHLSYGDGAHEEYLFEKWATETNQPEVHTLVAFDAIEENLDEWGSSLGGAVMDFCNDL